jgi:hypothetical protein
MKRIIFDEWFWADLNGDNGEGAQCETLRLLEAVFEKCDQLVTVLGSPFLRKYYNMAGRVGTGDPKRTIVKVFKAQFLQNFEKLCLLQEGSLPDMPMELEHGVGEDDQYLVRAYLAVKADLLVTTDGPLVKALNGCGIVCQSRDAFIFNYLGNDPTGRRRPNDKRGND